MKRLTTAQTSAIVAVSSVILKGADARVVEASLLVESGATAVV